MVVCSSCGEDVGESKFCPNCGVKIEKESTKQFCPNCGEDVGESKFCPNCGTKIISKNENNSCPNCGKLLNDSSKFCPYCGYSGETDDNDTTTMDTIIDIDDKISGVFEKGLSKSRLLDGLMDKTSSRGLKNANNGFTNSERKYWQKTEPVFLEVYDSIVDKFVRTIFWLERNKLGGAGSSVAGLVAASILTPTKDMSHEEALQFYQDMLNQVRHEINVEKQKGNFDEEEYYKIKFKESTIANSSSFAIPKSVKSWHRNKK